jgi:hypothetical protein
MNKITVAMLFLSFALTGVANAGDQESAYRKVCASINSETERLNCMKEIKAFEYFANAALDVCESMAADASKVWCVQNIGNKTYAAYEIEACRSQSSDPGKNSCLKIGGQPHAPPVPACMSKQEVVAHLQRTLDDIRKGYSGSAESRTDYLIRQLNLCP